MMLYPLMVFVSVVLIIYAGFIIIQTSRCKLNSKQKYLQPKNRFTIVVPFRNEDENLRNMLKHISNLKYPSELFEILFVNDHSTDLSVSQLEAFVFKSKLNCCVINLPNNLTGKQAAIQYAVDKAKHPFIVTTDADCFVPELWLLVFNDHLCQHDLNMICGSVGMRTENSVFGNLQLIDFVSMQSFGILSAHAGWPILANGANLLFRKKIFEKLGGYQSLPNSPSGDDVFLLHKFKLLGSDKIAYITDKNGMVLTRICADFRQFLHQKLRWASKSRHYKDAHTVFFSISLMFVQLFNLLAILAVCLGGSKLILAPLGLKLLAEGFFLFKFLTLHKKQHLVLYSIPLQILYPFYLISVFVMSQFMGFEWKGRKYKFASN